MLNYGALRVTNLEKWLTNTKLIISFGFLPAALKIAVNKRLSLLGAEAQVIVPKQLLCHYVTREIRPLFTSVLENRATDTRANRIEGEDVRMSVGNSRLRRPQIQKNGPCRGKLRRGVQE
jgi:hypothetical protein